MKLPTGNKTNLEAIRQRLAKAKGRMFWRSLEEAANTPEFQEQIKAEFPSVWEAPVDRRRMLTLMAASLGLAGLTGCSRLPTRHIVPWVQQPEDVTPGNPLFYATAMQQGWSATGLLVESHTGRPTKVEGNPQHPASLGATDVFAQASVLGLWDPERSRTLVHEGEAGDWSQFLETVDALRAIHLSARGAGFRLLTETVNSPTLAAQIHEFLTVFPEAKWCQYEPVNRDQVRAGALMAFGEDANVVYRVDRADVIFSLDADFLNSMAGSTAYARQFAMRRRVDGNGEAPSNMQRLYVAEPMPTPTGSMADHRFRVRAAEVQEIARELLSIVGSPQGDAARESQWNWLGTVAKDLQTNRGRSLVIAGDYQPPEVHAIAHVINQALGNAGSTVYYTDPVEADSTDQYRSMEALVGEMRAGEVDTLLILGGNPVYMAPHELGFAAALQKVDTRIHLGLYEDETGVLCHWHVPRSHFLESWSDARTFQGTCSVIQPLIEPLYESHSDHELLALFLGQPFETDHELVQKFWRGRHPGGDFPDFWHKCLRDGVVEGTALPPKTLSARAPEASPTKPSQGLEIVFRPDPRIWDGRYSNNGWLQELPKPISKLTWDNAAMMSPATAERLILAKANVWERTPVIELRFGGKTVKAPLVIVPGHADDSVTVHLGYGRKHGKLGGGVGFDAYSLRSAGEAWHDSGLTITRTGDVHQLAVRQRFQEMEGRDLVRVSDLASFRQDPAFAQKIDPSPPAGLSLYPPYPYNGYAWAMSIDLNTCTGCGACTIACQAENNIPVVGKEQVVAGRAMHWIRVDNYFHGSLDDPRVYNEPVPCMQCENAPCEVVCPVGATTHSDEGLNQMVYNRCVGTRYCSNNCPYKVRRFNFLQFSDYTTPSLQGLRNPDVTVRSRGVMEKCTYCVQRIQEAKIVAEREDRKVKDGEIVTACQQVCPVQAIVFGDKNDPKSHVSQTRSSPRNYGLLVELNTRPRTTYLARIRNPNPELEETSGS